MLRKIINIGDIINLKKMFPSLPTDNLYKFGFVGFVFLLSLMIYTRYNSYNKLMDLQLQNQIERSFVENERIAYVKGGDTSLTSKLRINNRIDELNKKIDNYERVEREFNRWGNLFTFFYFALSVFIVVFLFLWYYRLQRYQDILIKSQALNEKSKMPDMRS